MANKEAWISVAIVIVLLALGVFLTQKTTWFESSYNYSDFNEFDDGIPMDVPADNVVSTPASVECNSDSDCVKVQEDCCPCNSGGKDLCVAKSLEQGYLDNLAKCNPKVTICAQVFNCKINSCSCVNGKCEGN